MYRLGKRNMLLGLSGSYGCGTNREGSNCIIMRSMAAVPEFFSKDCRHSVVLTGQSLSASASSSIVSKRKLTGRNPSLQEIIADFGSFIHPS